MEFAEQVKAQVDIVRTVGDYGVRLRRMGMRYIGLCPFHTEKTPSFNVNPNIGIYKCFGCGVGGDIIKFVQEIESLTFWEALKSLAERNGIPIPQRNGASDAETELRAALYEMHEQAANWYGRNLFGPAGEEGREYLTKRGVDSTVARQFLLGCSEPTWDGLVRHFGNRFTQAQMEASGLFSRREDGSFYDKFRGRLMFPIHSEQGKVIGFGGRAMRPEDEPKYLNSPETAIYKKKHVLYNLHRAKDAIRKGDRTVLVEGYMDVIGVYAAGVRNVVASCGTALSPEQVRHMKRFSPSVVVNFDPDNAGANATERSIQMLLDEGMHMRILELEAGLDPDDFVRTHGAEIYAEKLNSATNYFIWLADRARKKFGSSTSEARLAGYNALLLPAIRRISDRLERASVAAEVAGYLNLDRNLVLAEFRKMGTDRPARPLREQPAGPESLPVRERVLLRSLLENLEVRELVLPRLQEFAVARNFAVWPIIDAMHQLAEEDPLFGYQTLESRLEEQSRALLSRAMFADHSSEAFTRDQAEGFLLQLKGEENTLRCRDIEHQLQVAERAGNMEEAMRLMKIAAELKRQLRSASA